MGHQGRSAAARLPAIKSNNRPIRAGIRQRQVLRGQGAHAAPPDARGAPPPGRLALRNWPVAWRLFAVIVLAAVMGLIFGGLQVSAAVGQAGHYASVTKLALLGQKGVALATVLEEERAETAMGLAANNGKSQALPKELSAWYGPPASGGLSDSTMGSTGQVANEFNQAAAGIDSSYPANVRAQLATVQQDVINFLPELRSEAWSAATAAPAGGELGPVVFYSLALASIFQLDDTIALSSGDPVLVQDVQQLGALSRATDQLSLQRAIVWGTLANYGSTPAPYFGANAAQDMQQIEQTLLISEAQQSGYLGTFQAAATPVQNQELLTTGFQSHNARMQGIESLIIEQQSPDLTQSGLSRAQAAASWNTTSAAAVNEYGQLESQVAQSIVDRGEFLQNNASRAAWETSILTGGFFLLVLLAALLVARSVVSPLRRLRAGALEVAAVSLPERVKAIGEGGEATDHAVTPINVPSVDEIGQVARAFDLVHQEAVRLAGNEAMLRGNLNAMFVSLSRRSQSLIERLSRTIDALELNEDDPERLSSLFAMDHLITRMRRNSENLLVLAGYEGARKRMDPVQLADVARAATSEIEQYDRVVLNVQTGIEISGQAATDIVHLLAEIIENATLYSPRTTEVRVTAQELATGGVLIEVTDGGVGISETRLEELNWRLEHPPVIDVSASRHMGLFAVAHLAARHGIRVRLRASSPRGLAAMAWLPATVAKAGGGWYGDRVRRLGGRPIDAWQAGDEERNGAGRRSDGFPAPARASGQALLPQAQPFASASGQQPLPTRVQPARVAASQSTTTGQETVQSNTVRPASNWFRPRPATSGQVAWQGTGREQAVPVQPGWAAPRPASGGMTTAGLPSRVPQASRASSDRQPDSRDSGRPEAMTSPLASPHGSGPIPPVPPASTPRNAPLPQRSPEAARSRLAGFQRGARRAEERIPRAGEGAER
ncbi:MAG TPA: nitrate- and nitrite sensing domain-containing protein [Trebonia sp.]|jgi:signal transduction histidine kinase|nr:nitrate- and nitrite sensing domain-containing protein [Trebonia sp.]